MRRAAQRAHQAAKAKAHEPAPAQAPAAGNREVNSGLAQIATYSFNRNNGKPKANGWEGLKGICVGGSIDFWSKKNMVEKTMFKAHL